MYDTIEELFGKIFFAATTLLVLTGAVTRAAGYPAIWAVDLAQATFAWTCMLGADIALRRNGHIEIDILVRLLPLVIRRALAMLWLFVIAAFLGVLIFYGTQLTLLNVERPMGDVDLSYAWVTAALPVGALLMLVSIARKLWGSLAGRDVSPLEGKDGAVL